MELRLAKENRLAYDAIASFYDRHWGKAFFSSARMIFREYLGPRTTRGSRVLDLCCGTGDFAEWLSGKGMAVSGVDNSAGMLEQARVRLPTGSFYEADMSGFRLPKRFDAVTCFYNSINQALDLAALEGCFLSVREHLAVGGWFLFDVIQEHGYVDSWDADDLVKDGDTRCEVLYRYDRKRGLALCHARVWVQKSGAASEYTMYQRPIEEAVIRAELERAGFAVEAIAPVRNAIPQRGRLAVLARAVEWDGVRSDESEKSKR